MNVVEPTCSNESHPDDYISSELGSNTFPAFHQHSLDYRRKIDLFNRAYRLESTIVQGAAVEAGKATVGEDVGPRFPLAYQEQGQFFYLRWGTIHDFTGTYWNTYSLTRIPAFMVLLHPRLVSAIFTFSSRG